MQMTWYDTSGHKDTHVVHAWILENRKNTLAINAW